MDPQPLTPTEDTATDVSSTATTPSTDTHNEPSTAPAVLDVSTTGNDAATFGVSSDDDMSDIGDLVDELEEATSTPGQ